ncbi:MAG: hypothetical protein ABSE76_00820 [Minisyncoccia bacterium]|jgi:hypothetical protein
MKIIRNGALDNQNNWRNLIRINSNEQIFPDELIAIAIAVDAYYIDKITYSRFINIRNEPQEREEKFETKYYCIEIAGDNKHAYYTREQLWEALATSNDAI